MYNIYSENTTGKKVYLTSFHGEKVAFTKELAKEQLAIFEQLPYKSKYTTWHKIKVK